MALKPEFSIMGGLAVSTIVYAVHSNATPPQADIRALPQNTPDIDKSERTASWISAGIVSGVSLIAKDPNIFIMGACAIVGMAWWTRHSNHVMGTAGRYLSPEDSAKAGSANSGPVVAETETYVPFQDSGFDR
ncbi:hypothetical protein ACWC9H_35390 [Streptomyces sp. NPDC001251]